MKTITKIFALIAVLGLTACGSTTTVTKTTYAEDGVTVASVEETVSDASDFNVFIQRGDGKVTLLNVDVTSVKIGQTGLSYFSGNGSSLTAPVGENNSSSATVLKYTATLMGELKTSVESDFGTINGNSSTTDDNEPAEEVTEILEETTGETAEETE